MIKSFDKKNMAKSRAVCEAMTEATNTGKRVLTGREYQILDMWPRFEDGELVMPGDKVHYASAYNDETEIEVESITVMDGNFVLCDDECRSNQYEQGQRVKRPVQSVLDADGVEIKVGDTVWFQGNPLPYAVVEVKDGSVRLHSKTRYSEESAITVWTDILTHIDPDSWERLEEDVAKGTCGYAGARSYKPYGGLELCDCETCRANKNRLSLPCDQQMAVDIIRRAKALAGVEVEA